MCDRYRLPRSRSPCVISLRPGLARRCRRLSQTIPSPVRIQVDRGCQRPTVESMLDILWYAYQMKHFSDFLTAMQGRVLDFLDHGLDWRRGDREINSPLRLQATCYAT